MQQAKKKSTTGTVVAVGPGKTHPDSGFLVKMDVHPGESVVYGEFDGTEISYQGSAHTLIRDDDILVKYKGDKITRDNVMMMSDKMLVRVETKEQETTGGLLIAPTAQKGNRPSVGEVVAVGPGRPAMNGEPIELDVEVGDMVKFRDFAGNEVQSGEVRRREERRVEGWSDSDNRIPSTAISHNALCPSLLDEPSLILTVFCHRMRFAHRRRTSALLGYRSAWRSTEDEWKSGEVQKEGNGYRGMENGKW